MLEWYDTCCAVSPHCYSRSSLYTHPAPTLRPDPRQTQPWKTTSREVRLRQTKSRTRSPGSESHLETSETHTNPANSDPEPANPLLPHDLHDDKCFENDWPSLYSQTEGGESCHWFLYYFICFSKPLTFSLLYFLIGWGERVIFISIYPEIMRPFGNIKSGWSYLIGRFFQSFPSHLYSLGEYRGVEWWTKENLMPRRNLPIHDS